MTALQQIVRFGDDSAGLEKTLRLFQGFCTILSGLAQSADDAESWVRLRSQFALGRRYFRLLKWHPCWTNAFSALSDPSNRGPLYTSLDVAKFSFLGLYFFLEMLTLTNALGVTAYEWGPKVQLEANKCWLYALLFSLLVSMHELYFVNTVLRPKVPSRVVTGEVDGMNGKGPKDATTKPDLKDRPISDKSVIQADLAVTNKLYTQLAIDFCDLFIPGSAVGWIPVGPVFVGMASTVSTSLAGRQIWQRVQRNAS